MNEHFIKSKNIIVEFLESSDAEDFGDKKELFFKLTSKIFSDFEDLENNKLVECNNEVIDKCINLLDFLRNVFFEIPISNKLTEFCITFSILIFNWNENTSKNDTIRMLSEKVKLTYEEKHMLIDLLNQSKKIIHMMKDRSNYTFVPELSKHYLKTFCDKEDNKS